MKGHHRQYEFDAERADSARPTSEHGEFIDGSSLFLSLSLSLSFSRERE